MSNGSDSLDKQPVVLRIYKSGALVGVRQFTEEQIVLGSQGDLSLPLEGENISPIHCALERREGTWYLADLGSQVGTKKGGAPVLDAKIEPGEDFEVAEYKIEFYIGIPKPRIRPPTAAPTAVPEVTPETGAVVSSSPPPVPKGEDAEDRSAALIAAGLAPRPAVAPPEAWREPQKVEQTSPHSPKVESEPKLSIDNIALEKIKKAPLFGPSPDQTSRGTIDIIPEAGGLKTVDQKPMPQVRGRSKSSRQKRRTFAPPSHYKNVKEFVKPTKGSVVEVMVAWRERVIATYSFSEKRLVTIGSRQSCDIPIPVMADRLRSAPIVRVNQPAMIYILPESDGELVRGQSSQPFADLRASGRIGREKELSTLVLEQGELVKMDIGEGISVIVRYVGEAPKPLAAPFLDLSTSELTGIVLAMAMVALLSLYMYLYSPSRELPPDAGFDEPQRTAVVVVKPTPIPPPPPPEPEPVKVAEPVPTPVPKPVATPKQVVRATPAPKKQPIQQKQTRAQSVVAKKDPGAAANPVPNRNKTGPRHQTSVKQGGAIKTTDSKASQMKSRSKDVSKAGIFSTFGGGGAQNSLAGQTTGSGELAGMSATATGKSGFNEDRPGEGLGSRVKDTGRGGTGKALDGIAGGIKTEGRGGGNSGYGTGSLGGRKGIKVVPGGEGESFSGTIDREAIRRVILANTRVIKACYERELNRSPDLIGKLVIEWDIGEKGAVLRTAVQRNELGNRAVADCLMARLKMWRFPEPPTNQVVTVAYPFVFSN